LQGPQRTLAVRQAPIWFGHQDRRAGPAAAMLGPFERYYGAHDS